MEYFCGLFDAEGYLALNPNGSFPICLEICKEDSCKGFQEKFGGKIYSRQRFGNKKIWAWKLNSSSRDSIFFLDSILPYSIIKKEQMEALRRYLSFGRDERRKYRKILSSVIRELKNPRKEDFEFSRSVPTKIADKSFFKWFAGLIDGDGNFVCNQYTDNRNNRKYFANQISFSSIYPEAIQYVVSMVPGCVTKQAKKGARNTLYKWSCNRYFEKILCESIFPFLRIKKEQCSLMMRFLHSSYEKESFEIINKMRHLNSL